MSYPNISGERGAAQPSDNPIPASPKASDLKKEGEQSPIFDTLDTKNQPATGGGSGGNTGATTASPSFPFLVDGQISAMQYANLIGSSKNNFQQTLAESSLVDAAVAKRLHEGLYDPTTNSSYNQCVKIQEEWAALVKVVNDVTGKMNDQIDKYNNGVAREQQATDAINADIEAYNNGEISAQQLSRDLDTYNGYANQRNQQIDELNRAIDAYNQFVVEANKGIDEINNQLEGVGYTGAPIPQLTPLPNVPEMPIIENPPGDPPLETLPNRSTEPHASLLAPPPSANSIANNSTSVQAEQQAMAVNLAISSGMSKDAEKNMEYLQSMLRSVSRMLPPLPTMAVQGKQYDPETREAIGTIPVAQRFSNILDMAMSAQEILEQSSKQAGVLFGDQTFAELVKLNNTVMLHNGLLASSPTVARMSGRLGKLSSDDPAITLASALSIVQGTKKIIESGMMRDSVASVLSKDASFQKLPQSEQEKLISKAAAASHLTLLNAASAQLSYALSAPGLTRQVMGQALEAQGAALDLGRSTFDEVLGNPVLQLHLESTLSTTLQKKYDFSPQSSAAIVAGAFRETLKSAPFGSIDAFGDQFSAQLKSQGIENEVMARELSIDVAKRAAAFTSDALPALERKGGAQAGAESAKLERASSSQSSFSMAAAGIMKEHFSLDPRIAQQAAAALDLDKIVHPGSFRDSLSNALQQEGISPREASTVAAAVVDATLRAPRAFASEESFKDTALRSLQEQSKVDAKTAERVINKSDSSHLIDRKEMERQVLRGVSAGNLEQGRAKAIAEGVAARCLGVPLGFSDQLAEVIVATSGMNIETAAQAASRVAPSDLLDAGKLQQALENSLTQFSVDKAAAKPIVGQMLQLGSAYLSIGKFTEVMRDLLVRGGSVDPQLAKQISEAVDVEGVIKREAFTEVVASSLVGRGVSPEMAGSMARRAAENFMNIGSHGAESLGIGAAVMERRAQGGAEESFLSEGLTHLLQQKGLPEAYASQLAAQLTRSVYDAKESFTSLASFHGALRTALQTSIRSRAFPVDIGSYLKEKDLQYVLGSVTLSRPLRREVLQHGLKLQLAAANIGEAEANKIALAASDAAIDNASLFLDDEKETREMIKNALLSQSGISEETAADVAKNLPLDLVSDDGDALMAMFEGRIMEPHEFSDALNQKVKSLEGNNFHIPISEEFSRAALPKGTEKLPESPSVIDLYRQQIDILTQGLESEEMRQATLEAVRHHFQQFEMPSSEMFTFLQHIMEPPNLIVKSMIETLRDAHDQRASMMISLRQNA